MSDEWTKGVNTLSRLALRVALDAPLRPPKLPGHEPGWGQKAGVSWEIIIAIREVLDQMDINWRADHRSTKR